MTAADDKRRKAIIERLIQIKDAEHDLLAYTRLTMPDHRTGGQHNIPRTRYQTGRHHELVAAKLHDLASGRIKRLILNMAPRHGKTELASKKFMPWFSAKNPEKSLIFGTYNEHFAQDIGRAVRENIAAPEHRLVFDSHTLKEGSASAQRLEVEGGGGMLAFVGRGGSITTLRRNGVAGTSATAALGTGDFSARALNIGSRNDASHRYRGLIFGLAVRFGPNLTDAVRNQAESIMSELVPGVSL